MHHLVALLAGCLLQPPADDPCKEPRAAQHEFLRRHSARGIEWNANGTIRSMKIRGLFLRSGLEDLKRDQPAPAILEAIGPALLARGTEELRVRMIDRTLEGGIAVKLDQFMNGLEVNYGGVNVVFNPDTNEVTMVIAFFMPDRGLHHEPRLSADEARAKAASTKDGEFSFHEGPAHLQYEFEQAGHEAGVGGGALVWVLSPISDSGGGQVMVDAATGKVVRVYATRQN